MEPLRFEFQAMASRCEIAVAGADTVTATHAAAAAEAEVRRIETKYSRFRTDSVVGRINADAHRQAVPLDAETAALVEYADRLNRSSGGLFDLTTGVLQTAWDFSKGRIPPRAELDRVLAHVGWRHVTRTEAGLRLDHPDVRIDFGGIGKEYAADRAADVLGALGIASGYVNLGGDIRTVGPKPDGSPWRFGIRHPRNENALIASIPLASGALATSGDYERYFERDGNRYCHVLSPVTGMPVDHWQSVSVLAPLAVSAGAMSTIAMLKQADALAFLSATGLSFLAIDRDGRIHTHKDTD
ncbi:MAG: hypothetical protein RIS35_3701 [Pseudomonadota bacterium]|jgi:thiamine biosynthesis lipoprotein